MIGAIEIWKSIPGAPTGYEVSSLGRVKNPRGKILKVVLNYKGYHYIKIQKRNRYLHALVLEAFVGPKPEGMLTRHLDGNKTNNDLSNLTWGTPAENSIDSIAHGHTLPGEKNPSAKLTWAQVAKIRSETGSASLVQLGLRYGVSKTCIRRIHKNQIWRIPQ